MISSEGLVVRVLKQMDKDARARVAEAVKNAKRALKSRDAAQMNAAAQQLEDVLQQSGVHVDPNAEYRGSAGYKNPNGQYDDDVIDAEFESVDDN